MNRAEIRDRATQRAAERASGRRRPNLLEIAAARTRATHELEEAECFYVSAGVAQFEALLAEVSATEPST